MGCPLSSTTGQGDVARFPNIRVIGACHTTSCRSVDRLSDGLGLELVSIAIPASSRAQFCSWLLCFGRLMSVSLLMLLYFLLPLALAGTPCDSGGKIGNCDRLKDATYQIRGVDVVPMWKFLMAGREIRRSDSSNRRVHFNNRADEAPNPLRAVPPVLAVDYSINDSKPRTSGVRTVEYNRDPVDSFERAVAGDEFDNQRRVEPIKSISLTKEEEELRTIRALEDAKIVKVDPTTSTRTFSTTPPVPIITPSPSISAALSPSKADEILAKVMNSVNPPQLLRFPSPGRTGPLPVEIPTRSDHAIIKKENAVEESTTLNSTFEEKDSSEEVEEELEAQGRKTPTPPPTTTPKFHKVDSSEEEKQNVESSEEEFDVETTVEEEPQEEIGAEPEQKEDEEEPAKARPVKITKKIRKQKHKKKVYPIRRKEAEVEEVEEEVPLVEEPVKTKAKEHLETLLTGKKRQKVRESDVDEQIAAEAEEETNELPSSVAEEVEEESVEVEEKKPKKVIHRKEKHKKVVKTLKSSKYRGKSLRQPKTNQEELMDKVAMEMEPMQTFTKGPIYRKKTKKPKVLREKPRREKDEEMKEEEEPKEEAEEEKDLEKESVEVDKEDIKVGSIDTNIRTSEIKASLKNAPNARYYYPPKTNVPLPTCFHNPSGYVCCNLKLNNLIEEAFHSVKAHKDFNPCNIGKIARVIQKRTQETFDHPFESIVSLGDFAQNVHFAGDLVCKVEIDGKFMLAYGTPYDAESAVDYIDEGTGERKKRKILPIHQFRH